MRLISNPQTTFCFQHTKTSGKEQWNKIAEILDVNPEIAVMAWHDLNTHTNGVSKKDTGAKGMTASQILRFAIVKVREELSYRRLHDRVDDSITLRGKIQGQTTDFSLFGVFRASSSAELAR